MKFDKKRTVAFVGECVLTAPSNGIDINLENVIKTELSFVLEELCLEGKTNYLISLTKGFGLLVAETVLEFRKKHLEIKIYVIISNIEEAKYQMIIDSADDYILIEDNDNTAHLKLNDFLINNSSEIILYDDDNNSEIKSLALEAEQNSLDTFNMYDTAKDYFSIEHHVKHFLQDYPDVKSFRYGREGIIFEGDNRPFPVHFGEIKEVAHKGGNIEFTLIDKLKIIASINTNDCVVDISQQQKSQGSDILKN